MPIFVPNFPNCNLLLVPILLVLPDITNLCNNNLVNSHIHQSLRFSYQNCNFCGQFGECSLYILNFENFQKIKFYPMDLIKVEETK